MASVAPSGRFERIRRLGEGANAVVYEALDRERGTPKTFLWLIEEIGELATALNGNVRC